MATKEERVILEHEYVHIYTSGQGNIVLYFGNENEKPLAVGRKMNEINEEAYMNGYNWDAFFNYYLAENAPDIRRPVHMLPISRIQKKTNKKQNALPTSSSL